MLPRDPWQVVIGPLLVVLVAGGVTLLTRDHPATKAAALRALAPVVVNPRERFEGVTAAAGPEQGQPASRAAEGSKPRVEIRLHNRGTRRAVLTSARFVVRRFAIIPGCGRGAGLELSARYDVTLPDRAGAAVEVPIDQQLGPDEADRFAFRLTAAGAMSGHVGQDLFYELDVGVRHDDERVPLPAGRVVVAIPGTPDLSDTRFFSVPGATTCSRRPPAAQLAPTTFTGVRSPELDTFLQALRRAGQQS